MVRKQRASLSPSRRAHSLASAIPSYSEHFASHFDTTPFLLFQSFRITFRLSVLSLTQPIRIKCRLTITPPQAISIEKLWKRAVAPDGSAERNGLPTRCNKAWFCSTFLGGSGEERTGEQPIWDLVQTFNMYDPLALLVAVPSLRKLFDFSEFTSYGQTHHVVGISTEKNGVRSPNDLLKFMTDAFMEGITLSVSKS